MCGRPVGGAVVAVVGQKVIVELPEDVQRDASVGGRHVVVGLPEHGVEAVQGQELTEELVSEAVDVEKAFQFLSPSATDGRTTGGEKQPTDTLKLMVPVFEGEEENTMMEVRSSLSNLLMASSRDL